MFSKTKRFGEAFLEFGNKKKNSQSSQRVMKSPQKDPLSPLSQSELIFQQGENRKNMQKEKLSPYSKQFSRSPSIQSARKRYKDDDEGEEGNKVTSQSSLSQLARGRMSVQLPKKESQSQYMKHLSFVQGSSTSLLGQNIQNVKSQENLFLDEIVIDKNRSQLNNAQRIEISKYGLENKENIQDHCQKEEYIQEQSFSYSVQKEQRDEIFGVEKHFSSNNSQKIVYNQYKEEEEQAFQPRHKEYNQTLKKFKELRNQQKEKRISNQGTYLEHEAQYQDLIESFAVQNPSQKQSLGMNEDIQQILSDSQMHKSNSCLDEQEYINNGLESKQSNKTNSHYHNEDTLNNLQDEKQQISFNQPQPMDIAIENIKQDQKQNQELFIENDFLQADQKQLSYKEIMFNKSTECKQNMNKLNEKKYSQKICELEQENERLLFDQKQKDERIKYLENEIQQMKSYYESKDRYQQDYLNNFLRQNLQLKADIECFKESEKILEQQHDQIIQFRGNLRIFCRIKPVLQRDASDQNKKRDNSEQQIMIQINERHKQVVEIKHDENAKFFFDSVFDINSKQEDVFNQTHPFIQCALNGDQVSIIAYGQTGSGKTYTMEGVYDKTNIAITQESGILPRTALYLFKEKDRVHIHRNLVFTVGVIEVYCEELRDLLQSDEKIQQKLEIVQSNKRIKVMNQTFQTVRSAEELLSVIKRSSQNRITDKTAQNSRSSRSHCIYQIKILENNIEKGGINIVDLAGSESFQATSNKRESSFINKSLTTLKRIITMLSDRSSLNVSKIPYRESKLTRLLQDSLGGDSKTLIFVTVCPLDENFIQTKESLKFISKATL